jgi:hypothetical protein
MRKFTLLGAFVFVAACNKEAPPLEATTTDPDLKLDAGTAPATTHTMNFVNNCATQTIWVGSSGNAGFTGLNGGGWEMGQKGSATDKLTIQVDVGWSGRIWPRTGCTFNAQNLCDGSTPCCTSGSCLTADNKTFGLECAYGGIPPVGLVEFTFDAAGGFGPYDTYDVSFVDGWGESVAVEAVAGSFNPQPDPGLQAPWCTQAGCVSTPVCPSGLSAGGDSCWSPCQNAVNSGDPTSEQTKLCCVCSMTNPIACGDAACAGGYGCTPYHTPAWPADQVCNPWNTDKARAWDTGSLSYISNLKTACPQAYGWQFDDANATFNCRKTDGLVDYTVTFCPG